MLELNYSSDLFNFRASVFPKTVVFLKSFSRHKHDLFKSFILKSQIKKHLTVLPSVEAFRRDLTVLENLETFASIFDSEGLVLPSIYYFNLERNTLVKNLTMEELTLLPFCFLFLKETPIWFANVQDASLSENSKEKIAGLFSSKINNQKAIVFYSTQSCNSLFTENEIEWV
jgi:ABC-type transport system involved in cytochrome c biogenesis ATPase subunit